MTVASKFQYLGSASPPRSMQLLKAEGKCE